MRLFMIFALAAFVQGHSASAFEIILDNPDLDAALIKQVGDNPVGPREINECWPASDDHSTSGQILAQADWLITSEVEMGGYELVSFAHFVEIPPQGGCSFHQGMISLWHDGEFVALIQGQHMDHQEIGVILPAKDGSVTIKSGGLPAKVTGHIRYDQSADIFEITKP